MPTILDRIESSQGYFRPHSLTEFFALQLAKKLDDEANLGLYLRWSGQHDHDKLLQAFARTQKHRAASGTMPDQFESEIRKLTANS